MKEIEVQISTVGTVIGSDTNGNPVEQTIDEASLNAIAERLNSDGKEVLVDIDHQSEKPTDRDTRAMGWLSRFWTSAKGLFGLLKLTPKGEELVEGREYRKLSPSFLLDENGRPIELTSVAFTNTPAMEDIKPILNQKPKTDGEKEEDEKKEEDEDADKTTESSSDETAGDSGNDSVQTADENGQEEVKDSDDEKDSENDTCGDSHSESNNPEELVSMWKQNCDALQKTVSELKKQLEDVQNECSKLHDENDSLKKTQEEERAKNEHKHASSRKEAIKESALNQLPANAILNERPWGTLKGDDLLKWARKNNY